MQHDYNACMTCLLTCIALDIVLGHVINRRGRHLFMMGTKILFNF